MNTIEINIDTDNNPLSLSLNEKKLIKACNIILNELGLDNKELSLYFCNNLKIKELNKKYRNKDYPTDVLSFESGEEDFLGDIAISIERAEQQKAEYGSPSLDLEILRLLIHGILHLVGYEHENDENKKQIMLKKENKLIMEVEKLTLF